MENNNEIKRMQYIAGLITESEYQNDKTFFNTFKRDFDDTVKFAGAFLQGDNIVIYLDNNPNAEKNLINKLIRTKYSDKLKKLPSEPDVMKFKVIIKLVRSKTIK